MPRYTLDEQASAVALVQAGHSQREAARALGAGDASVRRWNEAAERRETAREKELAAKASAIRARLTLKQQVLREQLLNRMMDAAETATLKDAAVAYGIVTDKAHLESASATHSAGGDPISAYVAELEGEALRIEWQHLSAPLVSLGEPTRTPAATPDRAESVCRRTAL